MAEILPRNQKKLNRLLFHTVVTASDSVYNTWQCRVMYYWFKKLRDEIGDEFGMGGSLGSCTLGSQTSSWMRSPLCCLAFACWNGSGALINGPSFTLEMSNPQHEGNVLEISH
ncbi:hypothetical protein JHK82_027418 [Glycine max]|nr:hypothetical protein JHK82_027418 [Glycine max]